MELLATRPRAGEEAAAAAGGWDEVVVLLVQVEGDIPSSMAMEQAASVPTAVAQTGPQVRLTPRLHPSQLRIQQLPRSRRRSIHLKTTQEHPGIPLTVEGRDTMHEGPGLGQPGNRRLLLLLVTVALPAIAPLRQVRQDVPIHQRLVMVTRLFQPLLLKCVRPSLFSLCSRRDTRAPTTHTQVRFLSSLPLLPCLPTSTFHVPQ